MKNCSFCKGILCRNFALSSVLFVLVLLTSLDVFATSYYVATTGNDVNNGTAVGTPKLTLSNVFSTYNLGSGDIINIAAGTYTEKNITIGADDEGFSIVGAGMDRTIYDSDQTARWMLFNDAANDNITISYLKIIDYYTAGNGGGIFFLAGASNNVFSYVAIQDCDAGGHGGGVYLSGNTVTFNDCYFYDCNVTSYGGGICGYGSTLTVSKCIFDLGSGSYGSAIDLESASTATITNSLFHSNTASGEGTISFDASSGTLMNCTIAGNTATTTQGISTWTSGTVNVTNTICYNSGTYDFAESDASVINITNCSYTGAGYLYSISGTNTGSVTGTPTFVNSGSDIYAIQTTSNCKNAGTATGAPADDIAGVARSSVDIGCFEFTTTENVWIGVWNEYWSNAANWSRGVVPSSTTNVTVPNGKWFCPTIHSTVIASCLNLTIDNGATVTNATTSAGGGYLDVFGNLTNNGTLTRTGDRYLYMNGTSKTLGGTGTFTAACIYLYNGSTTTLSNNISIQYLILYNNAGTTLNLSTYYLTVTEDFTQEGTINFNSGTLEVQGVVYNPVAARWNCGTGLFYENIDFSGTWTSGFTFYDFKVNCPGFTYSIGANLTVSRNLTVVAGTLATASYTLTVGGTVTNTGTMTISTGTVDVAGNFDSSGGSVTFTDDGILYLGGGTNDLGTLTNSYGADATTGSTVVYDAAGAQNVDNVDYYNLTIDGSGTKTLMGNIDIGGSNGEGVLTVDTGCTFAIGDYTITHTALDDLATGNTSIVGTVTLNNGSWTPTYGQDANLTTSGSITVTGTGTIYLRGGNGHTLGTFTAGSGTVYYTRNGAMTIAANTFNHLIIDGTSGTKTLGGAIDVNGNLTLTSNGGGLLNVSASNYAITLAGNWTNNGTFTAQSGTVTFDGGAAQTLSGTSATTFYNLTNSNSSTGVTLGQSCTVTNTLHLNTGLLKTVSYTLSVGTNASNGSITGGGSTNYIVAYDNAGTIGYLKRFVNSNATYSFPIGDATNYTPLSLTFSASTLTNAYLTGYTKATKVTGLNTAITQYINRFWSIEPTGITSPTYDISYTYVDGDIVGGTEVGMLPIKKSGSTWYKPTGSSFTNGTAEGTGSVTAGSNLLSWTGLSTFSLYGGAVNGAVTLPIELVSFTGEKQGRNNELKWTTASELNNDFFTIEKTIDGENFEIVENMDGAGNSSQYLNYSLIDFDVDQVINYYRLKQTDFDGKYTFSPVISIDNRLNSEVKTISHVTNILGQEVNEFYRGVVIIVYSDGTSVKVIQ